MCYVRCKDPPHTASTHTIRTARNRARLSGACSYTAQPARRRTVDRLQISRYRCAKALPREEATCKHDSGRQESAASPPPRRQARRASPLARAERRALREGSVHDRPPRPLADRSLARLALRGRQWARRMVAGGDGNRGRCYVTESGSWPYHAPPYLATPRQSEKLRRVLTNRCARF